MSVNKASSLVRAVAVAVIGAAIAVSGPAFAQQKAPAAPAKKPAAPAAAPAAPAAAPAAPPADALVLQVKSEPSQANWIKICGEDQNTKKKICYTTRDFVSEKNQPVLAVAVYDIDGKAEKVMRLALPQGFLLEPGVRYAIGSINLQSRFQLCAFFGAPSCFSEVELKPDAFAAFKKGDTIDVSVQNPSNRVVTFKIPLADFGKAFDGPPVDPAVLAAEQKRLQEQMQKQAEEMRQKMGGQPPAGGATPPAAPAQ